MLILCCTEHIPFAYQLYANSQQKENDQREKSQKKDGHQEDEIDDAQNTLGALETGNDDPRKLNPEDYKRTFCTSITIDFVGVWSDSIV